MQQAEGATSEVEQHIPDAPSVCALTSEVHVGLKQGDYVLLRHISLTILTPKKYVKEM